MDSVRGGGEILVDEVCRVSLVGVDTSDLGGCDDDDVRSFVSEVVIDRCLIAEIELLARGRENFGVSGGVEGTAQCTADHTAATGDEDSGVLKTAHRKTRRWLGCWDVRNELYRRLLRRGLV